MRVCLMSFPFILSTYIQLNQTLANILTMPTLKYYSSGLDPEFSIQYFLVTFWYTFYS